MKITKIREVKTPTRGTECSAGLDFYVPQGFTARLTSGTDILVPSGIRAEVPHGYAVIKKMSDYIVFKNWWSSGRYFTWTRSNDMWSAGCFHGTGEELIKKAYADSEEKGREYERIVRYVESIKSEIK